MLNIRFIGNALCVNYAFLEQYYPNPRRAKSDSNWSTPLRGWVRYTDVWASNKSPKNRHKKALPTPESLMEACQNDEIIKQVVPNGGHEVYFEAEYGAKYAGDFARAAAWLEALCGIKARKEHKTLGFKRFPQLLHAILPVIQAENLRGLQTNTVNSLRVKLGDYAKLPKETRWQTVADERVRISALNATKISPSSFHETTLLGLLANFDGDAVRQISSVYSEYLGFCRAHKQQPVAQRTAYEFAIRPETQMRIGRMRYGNAYAKDYLPDVMAAAPKHSLEVVCWDGVPLGAVWKDKNGELRWRYTIVVILDVASNMVIGWDMGPTETTEMYRTAQKRAMQMTGNKKYRYSISDRGSAFTAYEGKRVTDFVSEQHKYVSDQGGLMAKFGKNPQANPVERFGKFLQEKFREKAWWTGLGVKTKNATSRKNEDEFTAKAAISEAELKQEINSAMAEFSATKREDGRTNAQFFHEEMHPEAVPVMETAVRMVFGQIANRPIKVNKGRIRFKDNYYSIPKFAERGMRGDFVNKKVRVLYDPDDLSKVDIYKLGNPKDPYDTSKDVYLCEASMVAKTVRSPREQTEETQAAFEAQMAFKNETAQALLDEEKRLREEFGGIAAEKEAMEAAEAEARLKYPFAVPKTADNSKANIDEATKRYYENVYAGFEPAQEAVKRASGSDIDPEPEEEPRKYKLKHRFDF